MRKNDKRTQLDLWNEELPPALTAEQDLELLKEYRMYGDQAVKKQIFEGNLRWVRAYVQRYCSYMVGKISSIEPDMEDLFQVGALALWRAIDFFDGEKYKFKFSTYAGKAIFRNCNYYVKLRSKSVFANTSFDSTVGEEDDDAQLEEVIADPNFDVELFHEGLDVKYVKEEILSKLPPRQQEVFDMYFLQGKNFQQIADFLGMSNQGVQDYCVKAVQNVRKMYFEGTGEKITSTLLGARVKLDGQQRQKKNQAIIKKYGREFFEKHFVLKLPKRQAEIFDKCILSYAGQPLGEIAKEMNISYAIIDSQLRKIYENIERYADEEFKHFLAGESPNEETRISLKTSQKINRTKRLVEEYGGAEFLRKYFVPFLKDREREYFEIGVLNYQGESMTAIAKKLGCSLENARKLDEKIFDKLKTADFEKLVAIIDHPEEVVDEKDGKTKTLSSGAIKRRKKEREEVFEKFGGKESLRKYLLPMFSKLQRKYFEDAFLSEEVLTDAQIAEKNGFTMGQIYKAKYDVMKKLRSITPEELIEIFNKSQEKATITKYGRKTSSAKFASKRQQMIADFGGEEFLKEVFVSRLKVPAHRVLFEEYILNGKSIQEVDKMLKLNKNSSYIARTTYYLKKLLKEFKSGFEDFEGAVQEFYAKKEFERMHPETKDESNGQHPKNGGNGQSKDK